MKKLIFTLLVVLIGIQAYGQNSMTTTTTTTATTETDTDNSGEFKKGYIGGRLLATYTSFDLRPVDNSTIETEFVVGYGGGGVIGLNFSEHVGMQLEVLYSSLAQRFRSHTGMNRRLKVSYINVPLLLVLNTDVTKGFNFNVAGGPQLGLNTGSSIKDVDRGNNVDSVQAVFSVKSADLGVAYGFGVDFLFGDVVKLNLGYRGVLGLVDISERSQSTTNDNYYIIDRAHVNTYSLYAGLSFLF